MIPDTTFVQPITDIVTNPATVQILVGLLIAGLTFIFGLLKIPKGIAASIVQYAAIIVIAILEAQLKAKASESRGTALYTGEEKMVMATEIAYQAIQNNPKRDIFGKITKTLGGIDSVVNIAYPIVKPFLKKG